MDSESMALETKMCNVFPEKSTNGWHGVLTTWLWGERSTLRSSSWIVSKVDVVVCSIDCIIGVFDVAFRCQNRIAHHVFGLRDLCGSNKGIWLTKAGIYCFNLCLRFGVACSQARGHHVRFSISPFHWKLRHRWGLLTDHALISNHLQSLQMFAISSTYSWPA